MSYKTTNVKGQFQRADEHAGLIARLRTEKAESEERDQQMGFDEGVHYGQEYATYDEFRHLEELEQVSRSEPQLSGGDLVLGTDIVEHARDVAWETMREGGIVDETVLWEGWLTGVMSVWTKVKQSL